jgi:hypothetical protein
MAIPSGNNVRELSVPQLRDLMICPFSYELFQNPVTEREGVCGGHTFERVWIDAWLASGNNTCPLTRTHLMGTDLIENSEIRDACRLLDPNRVDPLDADDMEIIYIGAEALLQRRSPAEPPLRVPQELHDNIFEIVSKFLADAAGAYKTKASEVYGC